MMIVEQMLKNAPKPLLHIADVSGSALFQGDCLDIMPLIPDKSVQLILADLPYGTTACKWDTILPFDQLWKDYERIIKDDGVIVLTASQPFTSALVMSNLKMFKYEWIWEKTRGSNFASVKYQPFKKHENILVFSKSKGIYYPQFNDGEIYKSRTQKKRDSIFGEFNGNDYNPNELRDKRYPDSIIRVKSMMQQQLVHKTQKPLELMKYLILTYSKESDMVLDNTMGSGTTCLAAKELDRKFIGIEKESKYYEIACQRCGF